MRNWTVLKLVGVFIFCAWSTAAVLCESWAFFGVGATFLVVLAVIETEFDYRSGDK